MTVVSCWGCSGLTDLPNWKLIEILESGAIMKKIKWTTDKPKVIYENLDMPECIICLVGQKNAILNCGHFDLCSGCVETVWDSTKKCPICRSKITSVYRVQN